MPVNYVVFLALYTGQADKCISDGEALAAVASHTVAGTG